MPRFSILSSCNKFQEGDEPSLGTVSAERPSAACTSTRSFSRLRSSCACASWDLDSGQPPQRPGAGLRAALAPRAPRQPEHVCFPPRAGKARRGSQGPPPPCRWPQGAVPSAAPRSAGTGRACGRWVLWVFNRRAPSLSTCPQVGQKLGATGMLVLFQEQVPKISQRRGTRGHRLNPCAACVRVHVQHVPWGLSSGSPQWPGRQERVPHSVKC